MTLLIDCQECVQLHLTFRCFKVFHLTLLLLLHQSQALPVWCHMTAVEPFAAGKHLPPDGADVSGALLVFGPKQAHESVFKFCQTESSVSPPRCKRLFHCYSRNVGCCHKCYIDIHRSPRMIINDLGGLCGLAAVNKNPESRRNAASSGLIQMRWIFMRLPKRFERSILRRRHGNRSHRSEHRGPDLMVSAWNANMPNVNESIRAAMRDVWTGQVSKNRWHLFSYLRSNKIKGFGFCHQMTWKRSFCQRFFHRKGFINLSKGPLWF